MTLSESKEYAEYVDAYANGISQIKETIFHLLTVFTLMHKYLNTALNYFEKQTV